MESASPSGPPSKLRERIAAAAVRVAKDRPIDQVTITEVASEAGVSRPTVRRYIGDKAGLRRLLRAELGDAAQAHPDTRSRILAAAWNVFSDAGYQGTTMDAVATEAGLTKGAVYWHFPTKADLFIAICFTRVGAEGEAAPAVIEAIFSAPSIEEGLEAFITELLNDDAYLRASRLMLEFILHVDDQQEQERMFQLRETVYAFYAEPMRELQKEGRFSPDVDPQTIMRVFDALVRGLALYWGVRTDKGELMAMIPSIARIIAKGAS